MGKLRFIEQGRLIESDKDAGRYLVRIIAEGQGSSARYDREMLEENATAFSESLSFQNHPVDPEAPWERDITQITGHVDGETWFQEDDEGVGGIYGYYVPDPDFKDKFDRYAKKIGLSIYISGEYEALSEKDGGGYVARSFDAEDPYKSVDVVIAAGAGGRFEKFQESLRRLAENAAGDDPVDRKDDSMDIEDVKRVVNEVLTAHLDDLEKRQADVDAAVAAQAADVEAEADKIREEAVLAYAEALKAIQDAGLLPTQVKQLEEHARKGEDVTKLVEDAKAVAADVRTEDTAGGRRFGESAGTATEVEFTAYKNWGRN